MLYKQLKEILVPRYEDVIFLDSDAEPKVDKMSDAETIDYTSDIEITNKRLLHPR